MTKQKSKIGVKALNPIEAKIKQMSLIGSIATDSILFHIKRKREVIINPSVLCIKPSTIDTATAAIISSDSESQIMSSSESSTLPLEILLKQISK